MRTVADDGVEAPQRVPPSLLDAFYAHLSIPLVRLKRHLDDGRMACRDEGKVLDGSPPALSASCASSAT